MKIQAKKILKITVCMLFCLTFILSAASCGNNKKPTEEKTTYKITVWVSESEGVADQVKQQIAKFNQIEGHNYIIEATVEGVTESNSATNMIADVESGADLYCFAQDQTARLVQAGALAKPGVATTETIKNSNDESAIVAATIGNEIMCYPLTSDNGYFLMYDKRYIKEDQLKDLATLVKACEDAGRNFSMETETSAWYLASFFFGVGCHSDWEISETGKALSISDNFNSDLGVIALKGMQQLIKSGNYVSSSSAADFAAPTPSAVVVTGTWGVNAAESAIGKENLGFAELPSFTVDGKTYHMGSYRGNKLMGVKPQSDPARAKALSDLALYLTGKECQLERFNSFGWGPSNKEAQAADAVQANAALTALRAQNKYATTQGQIDGGWWDVAKVIGTAAKEAALNDEVALKAALVAYDAALSGIINKTDDEAKMWSIIGGIMNSGWGVDFPMTERPAGTWTSAPLYIAAGESFKARMGKSWDVQIGGEVTEANKDGNFVVEEAGLYMIRVDSNAQTITLIPATFGVVGKLNGEDKWNTETDIAMTKDGDNLVYVSGALTLKANDELKVRFNNSWDYGDVGDNGNNYKVTADGSYQVKLTWNADTLAWTLSVEAAA